MRKCKVEVTRSRGLDALPLLAATLAVLSQPALADASLSVTVTGLKKDGAELRCALFGKPDGFPTEAAAIATTAGVIAGGKGVCQFQSVPTGPLAIAAYEDANGNGKLDTNAIGMPKEGLAFSRDARVRFGPPKFSAAAFDHAGGAMELTLKAEYY
ncbi:MAG: DUF2141 domain-containing protein [Burkholderiales bacterium]|nr:DUF2141 domain-containing protein [Burkholderiales bacterium]